MSWAREALNMIKGGYVQDLYRPTSDAGGHVMPFFTGDFRAFLGLF